jgi:putative nucleotidyltransferase with HDIG domain
VGLVNGHTTEGAVLCVPLHIRERTIGVIAVLRSGARQFEEDDELLLANIGSQVAVAIENYRLNLDVEHTYLETVMALALAVEAKEPYTAGHSKRVAFYAVKIAEAMGLDDETIKLVRHAGLLHDVGKIGIKDDILLKAGPLSQEEMRIMQQHSVIGEAIIKPLRSLVKVAQVVRCHHERYDGGGYPSGLQGEAIPFPARILVVADSYDAMMTDRPYRKRLTIEQVREELRKGSGTQFDPVVVEAFAKLLDEKEQRLARASS